MKTARAPFAALALSLSLAAAGPASAEEAAAPQEIRWTLSIQGKEAGSQTVRRMPDGSFEAHFTFADRGRGPDQTARYARAADGCFSRFDLTGVDYLKAPGSIRFERTGKKASWSSASETGKAEVDGAAFFLPLEGPPEVFGVLARALLAAPGGKLSLLPVGEASIEKLGTLTLERDGKNVTVRQVAISGLGFAPDRLWIDEKDGSVFATDNGWTTMVLAGWESALPKISAAQQESVEGRERELAAKLARRPGSGIAIVGARLFDSETGKVTPKTTVVVTGNRIAAVGADGEVEIPAGAEVIEARAKTLLPGLWDLHTHVGGDQGISFIASGVTSVRDLQDTRTPARFSMVAEHAAEIDPKSERFQAFVRLLKEKGVAVDPTVNVFEEMFLSRPGKPTAAWDRVIDRLPATIRRAVAAGGGGLEVPEGKEARFRESYQRLLQMIKALWDGGIPIEAGTDAAPGFALHRELELYAEAGIPAPAVLQIATIHAARILGQDEELGSVAVGKLADLVLIDGDPTTKISDVRRAVLTLKGGTLYDTAALWRAVGVAPVR